MHLFANKDGSMSRIEFDPPRTLTVTRDVVAIVRDVLLILLLLAVVVVGVRASSAVSEWRKVQNPAAACVVPAPDDPTVCLDGD